MSAVLERQYETSPIHGSNAPYVEALYEAYLDDPAGVSEEWRRFFGEFGDAQGEAPYRAIVSDVPERSIVHDAPERRIVHDVPEPSAVRDVPGHAIDSDAQTQPQQSLAVAAGIGWEGGPPAGQASEKQAAVSRLIQVYSLRGHQVADLDPLGLWERSVPAVLNLDFLGLEATDLDAEFFTGGLAGTGNARMKLRDILDVLKRVYCGRVAVEFAHISRARERLWLRQRFEEDRGSSGLSREERRRVYASLNRAEGLERYLNTKFVGQKRFSLEGGETLIPILDDLISTVGERGIQEVVIGMAHRGRLNVLVNVLGKSPQELFSEFAVDRDLSKIRGSGDVKYHMGFSADVRTPGNNVHVVLAFNPSHLEIVNAVVEGSVRARQDRRGDIQGNQVLPVLIHGDAAFAGQGVVAETFQMSQTQHFHTGGTIHIVINNQIGFTIYDRKDARSTPYCSDIAKMVDAPVFHINGDDPEAAVAAVRLAARYRQAFHKDVVIDLVCYRRLGHNEADEPAVTQPVMYNRIRKHPTTRTLYGRKLVAGGDLGESELKSMEEDYRACLDEGRSPNEDCLGMIGNEFTVDWESYQGTLDTAVDTRISLSELRRLGALINTVPKGWKLHPRLQRIVSDRVRMAAGELSLDWGFAESLAYGSILDAGLNVRLIGQDSRRGDVLSSACILRQPGGRRGIRAAGTRHAPQRRPDRGRLVALRRSRAGFRIRLQHGVAGLPGDLGSAIRRLCQRRPGRDRPVHQFRRIQVGAAVRADAVLAARIRRPGSGTFVRTPRTFSATVRGTQYSGLRAVDAGTDVSHAEAAGVAADPQAADRHDAKEPVAAPVFRVIVDGNHRRQLQSADRR